MRTRATLFTVLVSGIALLFLAALATADFSEAAKQVLTKKPSTHGSNIHFRAAHNRSALLVNNSIISTSAFYTSYLPLISKVPEPLFFDDFHDPASGWPADDTGTVRWIYLDGEYEILIRSANYWAAATAPIEDLADYSVEADMRRQTGSTSDYGLIFDFLDWDNFYIFALDPGDQWYTVVKVEDGSAGVIVPPTSSVYINLDYNTNHLKVERLDSQINLDLNGQHLATVTDGAFLGDLGVGLYAESDSDAPASVRYDNFEIWQLGSELSRNEEQRTHLTDSSTDGGGVIATDR